MAKQNKYDAYSEQELVGAILTGNEEAVIYLIYNKYYRDIRYLCFEYCNSHEYVDDLCMEIYFLLRGKNCDWHPLSTWTGLASFRTWLNHVVQNWLFKNRDYLIGLCEKKLYSDEEDEEDPVEKVESDYSSEEENMDKVLLLEAISKLDNQDQKLVIIKELQGYTHEEIAAILNKVRKEENRVKLRKDEKGIMREIIADAKAVDVLKQRAIEQLRIIMRAN